MKSVLEKLAFQVFEFVLQPEERIVFPHFKGNVFRGSLGKALRRLTCASGLNNCKNCLLINNCIYSRNQEIRFCLTLIGEAMKYISYFILAFIDIGESGIAGPGAALKLNKCKPQGKKSTIRLRNRLHWILIPFPGPGS